MAEPRIEVRREDPHSEIAARFIAALIAELAARYPDREDDEAASFRPEEVTVPKSAFVIARLDDAPAGCGALRPMGDDVVELKRMYVEPRFRGFGLGRVILGELERLAVEFGYGFIVLETGVRQPEAIMLYESRGFIRVEPWGEYAGNSLSVCLKKRIS